MNKVFLLLIALLTFSLTIFFVKPLWVEPDSIAFYNRACLGGADFDTPILSRTIFSLLPCNELIWKIFHLTISLCGVSAIYYFGKKNLNQKDWFWAAFTSYYLLIFLLNIEDDQIAFPIIIAASGWLLSKPTWLKRIVYAIGMILISFLVWKGAFIPMSLFLTYTIFAIAPILLVLGYAIYNTITTGRIGLGDPGNTLELVLGAGFLNNNILMMLTLFCKDLLKKIKQNLGLFQLAIGFDLLAYYYPKLGYYSIIPLILLTEFLFDDKQKYWLVWLGILCLVLAPAIILFNMEPNQKTWDTVDKAVSLQKSGFPVYNEWWVGRWFFYKGGQPSQEGSNKGPQNPLDKEWYWLGTQRKDCGEVVSRAGRMVLQHCPA